MIKLRIRTKYLYFSFIRRIITIVSVIPTIGYLIYLFVLGFINKNIGTILINQQILLYCSIPTLIINLFFVVFKAFFQRHLHHESIDEFYEIVSLSKLPNILPKVVYVYTSHGDMYESRVLQNIQQTYKNIEVWISEGSEKEEVINKSKEFASKNNIHFFAVGGSGSANKSDNLNNFLKRSGAKFDFLLITDSDEYLHPRFVEYAIKCFQSHTFNNVGFISPWNFCYDTNNFFSNTYLNFEQIGMIADVQKNFTQRNIPNLFSASCIISKNLLDENNGQFPNGCLEDYFLESISLRKGFTSVMLPISPCGQAFDSNIKAYHKRTLRIQEWAIKLVKEQKIHSYNEKFTSWWSNYYRYLYTPILKVFGVLILSIVVWTLSYYWSFISNNALFLTLLIYGISLVPLSFICRVLVSINLPKWGNKLWLCYILVQPILLFANIPYELKSWFKALFLSKYSEFGGSGQKPKKQTKIKPIKWDIILFLILVTFIIALTLCYYFTLGWNSSLICLPYVIFVSLFGFFALAFLCEIILFILGNIVNNRNYSKDTFIKLPNAYKFEKIKAKFIKEHQNDPKYDLSCLKDYEHKRV